jgi:hypothetical protein
MRAEVDGILQERAGREPLAERFFLDEPPRDFIAFVGRMIVDDDELDIRKGLPVDALEALFDVCLMLVAGDNDAG